jgi:hypothetical protein
MQRTLTESIKAAVNATGLTWLDKVCGRVETIQEKIITPNGNITKSYPAYRDPNQTGCAAGNNYQRCSPDTKYKSLVYMEASEPVRDLITANYDEYSMSVDIVIWLNLKKLNNTYANASDFADELMAALPDRLNPTGAYNTIRMDQNGCSRDIAIINKYSYDEAESQYLIYPFDITVISLSVKFRRTKNCHKSTALNPSECNKYT